MLSGQGWGAHSVPLALFLVWFVASAACRGRAVVPLVCCAPITAVYCWVVSSSLAGWSSSSDDNIALLAEFGAAIVFGLWLGARVGRLRSAPEAQIAYENVPLDEAPLFVETDRFSPALDRRFVPARGETPGTAGRTRARATALRAA